MNTTRRMRKAIARRTAAALLPALVACALLPAAADTADRPLLTPMQALSGARLQAPLTPSFGNLPGAGASAFLNFLSPVAAAGRNHVLYIADAGRRQLFRYDPAQLALTRFTDTSLPAVGGIAIGPDLSLYVADSAQQRVLHFSWDGKPLPGFSNASALARPVAVATDDSGGQVYVADSLYKHVVVFNSLGRAVGTLRPDEARSIEAMARGPDGLYLVDRLARQVVVMGTDGGERYALGEGVLKDPHAIAVDRYNRVYVGDDFDNTIKVFEQGELLASFGGSGATPGRFNRIAFLSVDLDTLYVADSLNARVQSFHIAPPRREGR